MRLFQNHGLDREFSEIFRVGSTLIIRVTGLSCELEITKTGFLCQFFLLYLMDHELRCIIFPILKKIVFPQVILITFLFKFDSSIVFFIFFCLIELKLAYSIQLGSMTRVLNFCFF